jgi:hypothetical protein
LNQRDSLSADIPKTKIFVAAKNTAEKHLGNSEQICHNPTFENAAVEKRKCN